MRRAHHSRRRSGLTLVELAGAMAVTAIVIASTMGALQLFTLNGTRLQVMETARSQASVGLHRLRSELRLATAVSVAGTTSIAFAIPDTNGDGLDEQIVYGWSGTAGDPVTRRINGGTADLVVPDVTRFALRYDVDTLPSSGEVESAETTLFAFDAAGSITTFRLGQNAWIGECFHPDLPPEATRWKVTRLMFTAASDGPKAGTTLVQLRQPTVLDEPGGTVLEQYTMLETTLRNLNWEPFTFNLVSGLSPNDGLCLVLQHVSDKHSAQVVYQASGAFIPNATLVTSADQGVTWSSNSFGALQLYVYGTYMTPDTTVAPGPLKVVYISLESQGAGAAVAMRLDSAVVCLNRPSMGGFALVDLPILATP